MEQIMHFNAPSLGRNPKIMYVFDQLKLVEQRGLGFMTIRELQSTYGLPLSRKSYDLDAMSSLNEEELKGYDYVRLKGRITRKEYEGYFSFDKKKAVRHLTHFVELKLLDKMGEGPAVYYENPAKNKE